MFTIDFFMIALCSWFRIICY